MPKYSGLVAVVIFLLFFILKYAAHVLGWNDVWIFSPLWLHYILSICWIV